MRHLHRKCLFAAAACAAGIPFALPSAIFAQNQSQGAVPPQAQVQELAPDEAEDFNTGGIALDWGFDVTTAYYFRGIIQEDQGVIVQPYAEVGVDLLDSDQGSLTGFVGIWNSFHSEQTGSDPGEGADIWYEADLYGGVSFELNENISLGAVYTAYTSPNGAFDTIQEVGVTAAYAGSAEITETVNFDYEVGGGVFFEIDNAADGGDEGIYAEIGFEPSFGVEVGDQEVAIGLPIVAGFSVDDYYEVAGDDDNWGYVSVGITAAIGLEFIPEKYGDYELAGGLTALFLGDNPEEYNGGDDIELIGTVGISGSY